MITSIVDDQKSHLTIKVNLDKKANSSEGNRIRDVAYRDAQRYLYQVTDTTNDDTNYQKSIENNDLIENKQSQVDLSTQALINNLNIQNQVRSIVINKSEDLDAKKLALEKQELLQKIEFLEKKNSDQQKYNKGLSPPPFDSNEQQICGKSLKVM